MRNFVGIRWSLPPLMVAILVAITLSINAPLTPLYAATNSGTTSSKLISVTKKIIVQAAKVGLEEAGTRLMGSAWPYLKSALSPVFNALKERYPVFFSAISSSGSADESKARQVADEITNDPVLRGMIINGFANLSEGQRDIVNRIGEMETVLVQQNKSILDLQKETDHKLNVIMAKVDALSITSPKTNYTEGITMFDLEGGWTLIEVVPPLPPACQFTQGRLGVSIKPLNALKGSVSYTLPLVIDDDRCYLTNNDVNVDLYGSLLRLQATDKWSLIREISITESRMVLSWHVNPGGQHNWVFIRNP